MTEFSFQFPEHANENEKRSAIFIYSTLRDVVPPRRLQRILLDIIGAHEDCDMWSWEAIAETYLAVAKEYPLSREEGAELVTLLWTERCTIPGEELAFQPIALYGQDAIISSALETYDGAICERLA